MLGSIHKACDVLRALDGGDKAGCRLADIAKATDLTPPTAHRILRALCAEGFAAQNPSTRRYHLGPDATALGHPTPRRERLCQASATVLRELRDDSGETTMLTMFADGHRCILATLESPQPLRVVPTSSDDERFYETATGRALLALLPAEDFAPLRKRLGWPGRRWPGVFTDRDLTRELQVIRTTSLVVAEQRDTSITAMATPLSLPGIQAAIGLDYPAGRDSGGRRQTLGARLREAAQAIRERFLE
jgi:IclR family acetate operon transcriptional repressor